MKNLFLGKIILTNMKNKNFLDYIIIPMAGLGSRFQKSNFKTIKPMILVDNKSILEKSIMDLPNAQSKIIILNEKIYNKYPVMEKIFVKNNLNKILLKKPTLGQADTVYKTKNFLNLENNALIHSCDYILKFSKKKLKNLTSNYDVIIFVHKLKSRIVKNYNDFAYCKINANNNYVSQIVEKKTISEKPWNDFIVVGTFWFNKIGLFYASQDVAIKNNQTISGEFYVANNINNLIKKKYKVAFFEVDEWINLGDYFDYQQYIYWKNYFFNNKTLLEC